MLEPEEVEEEETAEEEYTEDAVEEEAEEEVSISEIVAEELEKGVSPRFDKVDEDIARIYELVSGIVVEETEEEISTVKNMPKRRNTRTTRITQSFRRLSQPR